MKDFIRKNGNILFFIGGFIFDTFTMVRIDSTLDLLWQAGYLIIITTLILYRAKEMHGKWAPSGFIAKFWHHETEALHFCYGGLLSGYVIFYFKSTSFSRSLVFLSLIAFLMIANEMPQVKRLGFRMRLGLYAFCIVSYLNYLLPVLIGRMGWWIFVASWVLACVPIGLMVRAIARYTDDAKQTAKRLCVSPALIMVLIMMLYSLKLIPPVPLSLRHMGIYRAVEKVGDRYKLTERKPPWHTFWRTDNHVFPARPGDELVSFISVFGPRRFTHQIFVHWSKWNPVSKEWMTSDRVPVSISGGREDGFRGFTKKQNYDPGQWRVEIETEDGRVLGSKTLEVQADDSQGERPFKLVWM